ncbi:AbrB/MazE/SpoVT family DNA-binding domain-containing protein [Candidatus Bathyarchaeota archaeon]|nr:AbrB/MazE/SpoVT family DNA-binding domain-containing protein [Candidatus Bathyarchaeota archaeon]
MREYENHTVLKMEEPEIAKVGTKGQVVIPQRIRRELGIDSKTTLALYTRGDKLVLTKVELPSLREELKGLFREIDERYKGKRRPSEREILSSIRAYRHGKRRS